MTAREFTRIRGELGISQARLAKALGVTDRTVRRIEAQDCPIPGPVERLMRAFKAGEIAAA